MRTKLDVYGFIIVTGSMPLQVDSAPECTSSECFGTGIVYQIYLVFKFTVTNTACVRAQLCKLQKRCSRLAAARDKVYQLLSHGRWFSPGTPASSTTKTGRHEILLKVALNTINQIKSNHNARILDIKSSLNHPVHTNICINQLCLTLQGETIYFLTFKYFDLERT